MFHVVAACQFPVGTKAFACCQIEMAREVGFRLDGEIRVAEPIGPLIVVVGDEYGGDLGSG